MEKILEYLEPYQGDGLALLSLALAALAGLAVHRLALIITRRALKSEKNTVALSTVNQAAKPLALIIPLLLVYFFMPLVSPSPRVGAFLGQLLSLSLIAALAWLLIVLSGVGVGLVLSWYRVDRADNLAARRVRTQLAIIRRVVNVIIIVVAFAAMLLVFDRVRQLGASILASAGIAGVILGFAAQRSLSTLIAGLQLAVTQPIRLDDVVVVEGEWGRIEEVTLTYVVVKIWDQRRLVLPASYFIERPFQNWTRRTAELLGTVYLYVDYAAELEPLRQELNRIVEGSDLWDGRLSLLQVTGATERSLELRILVSAADASTAWDLRCLVREKMLAFLQDRYPQHLPRFRAELSGREGTDRAGPAQ